MFQQIISIVKHKRHAVFASILVIACLLATLLPILARTNQRFKPVDPTQRSYWPTIAWRTALPEQHGVNPDMLKQLDEHVKQHMPNIFSVLMVRHGYLVFEKYYREHPELTYEVASVTKSVMSALVGIALHKAYLQSIDKEIAEFFPGYADTLDDPRVQEISLRHLLTMTSGLNWSEEVSWSWPSSKNWMQYILNNVLVQPPGEKFNYNTPAVHLLSGVIKKQTGMSTREFAERYLFQSLGIKPYRWENDPQGYNNGGRGLFLSAQDMARFGYLYLNNGFWDGKQIIPAEWVQTSTQRQNSGGFPEYTDYGYLWWVTEVNGYQAYFAAGYGGQLIYVIPALDVVVVVTSELDTAHPENKDLISQFIVPAVNH